MSSGRSFEFPSLRKYLPQTMTAPCECGNHIAPHRVVVVCNPKNDTDTRHLCSWTLWRANLLRVFRWKSESDT